MERLKHLVIILAFQFITLMAFPQLAAEKITINPDLEIIQLTPNIYLHVSWDELPKYGRFSSNGIIYTCNNQAFLLDTPPNDLLTSQLVDWIENVKKWKITGFVPNHWHSDCMGGLKYLQDHGIATYANQLTVEIAKRQKLPVPTYGFRNKASFSIGHNELVCYYPGPAHSIDNIVAWIPSEKTLFAGCLVKEMTAKNLGNTADGDLRAYPKTIKKLLRKFPDAKIVIPGHGNYGGIELLKHTKELVINK